MGISTKAVIVVGLRRAEFGSEEELEEWLNSGDLDCISPYFDGCGEDDAVCGIVVWSSEYSGGREFHWNGSMVEKAQAEFKAVTGRDAKVWISPYVI